MFSLFVELDKVTQFWKFGAPVKKNILINEPLAKVFFSATLFVMFNF